MLAGKSTIPNGDPNMLDNHQYIDSVSSIHTLWQPNIINYGKSPCSMGQLTISIAMFDDRRVSESAAEAQFFGRQN